MERNELFPTEGLIEVVIHLAWAQLEVFADDVDQIQVLVAGDEDSVSHLDISQKNGVLLVEQPQYGLHLNLASQCWMQVCVRIPRSWRQEIR
ncbi:MAG: hypothetical protein FWF86_08960, partial [Clostridia bacterium]|nr:hypothetical protein [Clostridia bacterium]